MQDLVEQSEIDALCDELRAELMLYNEHGGGAQNEAAYAELKRRIDDLANRLRCHTFMAEPKENQVYERFQWRRSTN